MVSKVQKFKVQGSMLEEHNNDKSKCTIVGLRRRFRIGDCASSLVWPDAGAARRRREERRPADSQLGDGDDGRDRRLAGDGEGVQQGLWAQPAVQVYAGP